MRKKEEEQRQRFLEKKKTFYKLCFFLLSGGFPFYMSVHWHCDFLLSISDCSCRISFSASSISF